MSYYIMHFNTYHFVPEEDSDTFEFVTEGGDTTSWTSDSCRCLRNAFKGIGLGDVISKTLPEIVTVAFPYALDDYDIEQIKNSIINPEECINLFNEHNVLEKIRKFTEGNRVIVSKVEYMLDKWNKGFYVILTD